MYYSERCSNSAKKKISAISLTWSYANILHAYQAAGGASKAIENALQNIQVDQ